MGLFIKQKRDYSEAGPTKRIVVAASSKGAGASFVTEILAYGLSKYGSVSVSELGTSHFYDSLGFEKNFLVRGFTDYFEKIKSGEHQDYSSSSSNSFDGINWIARRSGDRQALSTAELFRLFYMPTERFSIFDCSGIDVEDTLALLAEADFPVCVIDPLPSKLAQSYEFLEKVRISLPNSVLIVNKMNPGVHLSELNRFLGTKNYFSITSVNPEYIYKGEYNFMSFTAIPQLADYMGKTQDMLSRLFL